MRNLTSAMETMSLDLKPVAACEDALDDLIQRLSALEDQCDQKLEQLYVKKQRRLEATKMIQEAFKK